MKARIDAAGICLSAACAIHCAAAPVGISLAPLIGIVADVEWLHFVVAPLVLVIGISALRHGVAHHGNRAVYIPTLPGTLFLIMALFHHDSVSHGYLDPLLSSFGGLLFMSAHIWNLRLIRQTIL